MYVFVVRNLSEVYMGVGALPHVRRYAPCMELRTAGTSPTCLIPMQHADTPQVVRAHTTPALPAEGFLAGHPEALGLEYLLEDVAGHAVAAVGRADVSGCGAYLGGCVGRCY